MLNTFNRALNVRKSTLSYKKIVSGCTKYDKMYVSAYVDWDETLFVCFAWFDVVVTHLRSQY